MAHAGALATLTAEEYPGLTDFFVQVWEGSSDDSKVIFRAYGNSPEEARTRADLGADALNVHGATGLTPSQLQARVAELEAALADEREKSAFWAEKAHEMRGQALRGEPVDRIIQP